VARSQAVTGKRSAPPSRRPSIGVAAAALLLLALGLGGLAVHGAGMAAALWQGALYVLPALLLAIALLARRYPGERLLVLLHARRTRPRIGARPFVRTVALAGAHGGRLIALALAGRAPPAPRAAVPRLS
jgi:hypothetical protein